MSEAIIEFIRQGNSVKATAVDPQTGVEASIIGPASASQAQLSQLALAKLRYQLARRGGST